MTEKNHLTVKDWADDDKPREKMLTLGKKQLSNAELIAILIRTGLPGKNAVEIAKDVLSSTGNSLTALSKLEFSQLNSVKGMALAKSTTLMAALELGWRMLGEIDNRKDLVINNSNDLFNYMSPMVVDLDHEEFWAVYLNNHNRLISRQRISVGGQTETSVDIRVIFRGALENKAVKIMLVHNHPSGVLKPSREDRELTRQLTDAGRLLQIEVIEHLIIGLLPNGKADYFSLHDNGYF